MNRTFASIARSIWSSQPKYRGLKIMTIGFLVAVAGAGVALLGKMLGDAGAIPAAQFLPKALMYCGWVAMVFGAITMLAGIVINWWLILRRGSGS